MKCTVLHFQIKGAKFYWMYNPKPELVLLFTQTIWYKYLCNRHNNTHLPDGVNKCIKLENMMHWKTCNLKWFNINVDLKITFTSLTVPYNTVTATYSISFKLMMLYFRMGNLFLSYLHFLFIYPYHNKQLIDFINRKSKRIRLESSPNQTEPKWTTRNLLFETGQCALSCYDFHMVRFCLVGLGFDFINCLTSDLLLCPFYKELIIWEKMSLDFCQTDNPRFSFIMYCYWTALPVYT